MDVPAPTDPVPGAAAASPWAVPAAEVPWSAAPTRARSLHRLPGRRSASWAGFLGWLVPGLGQIYLGRWGAGLLLLVVIGATFAGGLALTDFTCVDPRTYPLEFVAQALIGGPMIATLRLTQGLRLERLPPWLEIGHLYVVVAGFLNLIAICDALGECWRRNARLHALASRLAVRQARPTFDAPPPGDEPILDAPALAEGRPEAAAPAAPADASVAPPSGLA